MRSLALLVGVLLLAVLCTPVFAQAFSDVPTDHWAYTVAEELSEKGLMVGYPDGTFSGKRTLTRYEFAMAISRVMGQISAQPKISGDFATKDDVESLEKRIAKASKSKPVERPKVEKSDIKKLRKLINEFSAELATLGADVDGLKAQLQELQGKVESIEKTLAALPTVSGVMSTAIQGRTWGTAELENTKPYYDLDLIINQKLSKGTATAVINAGNYLPWRQDLTLPFWADATEQVSLYHAYATIPTSDNATLTFGKFPFQLTPYTFMRPDTDRYISDWKTDSGDYRVLGVSSNFRLGKAQVTTVAGHSGEDFVGLEYFPAEYVAGVRTVLPTPLNGSLGLNYLATRWMAELGPYFGDERYIHGADLKFVPLRNIGVSGSWTRSEIHGGGDANVAWDGRVDLALGKYNMQAGYRDIGIGYDAPGSWGRIGNDYNPTGIEGPIVSIAGPVCRNLSFSATGEFYNLDPRTGYAETMPYLIYQDRLNHYLVKVDHQICAATKLSLSWEQIQLRLVEDGCPFNNTFAFWELGLQHDLNPNASFRLFYQTVDDEETPFRPNEGFLTLQMTVKF